MMCCTVCHSIPDSEWLIELICIQLIASLCKILTEKKDFKSKTSSYITPPLPPQLLAYIQKAATAPWLLFYSTHFSRLPVGRLFLSLPHLLQYSSKSFTYSCPISYNTHQSFTYSGEIIRRESDSKPGRNFRLITTVIDNNLHDLSALQ